MNFEGHGWLFNLAASIGMVTFAVVGIAFVAVSSFHNLDQSAWKIARGELVYRRNTNLSSVMSVGSHKYKTSDSYRDVRYRYTVDGQICEGFQRLNDSETGIWEAAEGYRMQQGFVPVYYAPDDVTRSCVVKERVSLKTKFVIGLLFCAFMVGCWRGVYAVRQLRCGS